MAKATSKVIGDLISQAGLLLKEEQATLKKLLEVTHEADDDRDGDGSSDEELVLKIQLVLQYRLSGEDALSLLLQIDHNLLALLGIQPQQSDRMNLDRLAYAVGHDDLKHVLNILAMLTGVLSKVAGRYPSRQNTSRLRHHRNQHLMINELSWLATKQKQLIVVLKQLDIELAQMLKLQFGEPIYDEIAALRGPISHFYQAIVHGLGQSKQLYAHCSRTPVLEHQLNTLIKETERVLHALPRSPQPQLKPLTSPVPQETVTEQLEQRASAKRLRPFFW